jgi:hypothetical protein
MVAQRARLETTFPRLPVPVLAMDSKQLARGTGCLFLRSTQQLSSGVFSPKDPGLRLSCVLSVRYGMPRVAPDE